MNKIQETKYSDKNLANRALFLLLLRLVLILLFSVISWFLLKILVNDSVKFPPGMLYATISLLPMNLICFTVVKGMIESEGESLT
ncbi:hypothetical protein [Enterococcus olivae]